jgi:hypothetical protein
MRRLSLAILATFLLTFTAGAVFAQDEPYNDPTQAEPTQTEPAQTDPMQAEPTDSTQTETADPYGDPDALPQTASDLPLVAGLGLLALAGAIVVRSGLKKSA